MQAATSVLPSRPPQFGLRSLLEFMAVAGLITAAGAWTGRGAAMLLLLFAMAVVLRRGGLALAALAAAVLVADAVPLDAPEALPPFVPVSIVLTAAGLVCLWKQHRG